MTRARWMLGALGALATIAFVPALPASATDTDVDRFTNITNITNVVDGSHWTVLNGPEVRAVQGEAQWLGSMAEWSVSHREDGSVTIRNVATRECAEADVRFPGAVRVAPCDSWKETQSWRLQERAEGYVISPQIAPDLAVSVPVRGQAPNDALTLRPQHAFDQSIEDARLSIFQINS